MKAKITYHVALALALLACSTDSATTTESARPTADNGPADNAVEGDGPEGNQPLEVPNDLPVDDPVGDLSERVPDRAPVGDAPTLDPPRNDGRSDLPADATASTDETEDAAVDACASDVPTSIAAVDPRLTYTGRIDTTDPDDRHLLWPGSALSASFTGTSVVVFLEDTGDNYLNVLVDGDLEVLDLAPGLRRYELARDLVDATHHLELNKRTETGEGDVIVHSLAVDPCRDLMATTRPDRRIEVFGDSITSGYSIECTCDEGDPAYKNNYLTYTALAARALGAEYHAISLSGVGIERSWWPANMLDYWDNLRIDDHAWDFSRWQPQVVVINLGQNDYWLGVGAEIVDAYEGFMVMLRAVYPSAEIILALGSMNATEAGSPYPGYVRQAVTRMNTVRGDTHVSELIFPYNGTGIHPVESDNVAMAEQLRAAIVARIPAWAE